MDRKTRKTMNMYQASHRKGNVDKLYMPKKIGDIDLLSTEERQHQEQSSGTIPKEQ